MPKVGKKIAVGQVPRELFWAKTGPAGTFHPLPCHVLDVGNVALQMLGDHGPLRIRSCLRTALDLGDAPLLAVVPALVALHDLGKLSAAFQRQDRDQQQRLHDLEWHFPKEFDRPPHHSVLGAAAAERALRRRGASTAWTRIVAAVIAGHHGEFASDALLNDARDYTDSEDWERERQRLVDFIFDVFAVPDLDRFSEPSNLSAAVAVLCGFTILCDWIGSDVQRFPLEQEPRWPEYVATSRARAEVALRAAGFLPAPPQATARVFAEMFPDFDPRPLQKSVDTLPACLLAEPCLVVIEAPTGEGKTEAALLAATRLALGSSDELYFALPTEATSNQMHGRLQAFFGERVKLVHGHAFLNEDDLVVDPALEPEGASARAAALQWFAPRKRALLARRGVGTVDQAELAALNVRHGALRLFALAGKVLIIDEVHAYDAYMTTVIERLLEWLGALGAPVVLLSATLPSGRRDALVKAYGGQPSAAGDRYPLVTIARRGRPAHLESPPAAQPLRALALRWIATPDNDPDARARILLDQVQDGGCAAWICNTVARAQAVYKCVRRLASDVPATLLHSRFPVEDRARIEASLTRMFGPGGAEDRPRRAIVVGTQVLEQSLDVDFDVLISDLAPIDLLLQRAGRMHRHHRTRPARHEVPVLYVNTAAEGADQVGTPDTTVYDEYILRRTLRVLRAAGVSLELPGATRALIEKVYTADGQETGLEDARAAHERREEHARGEARLRLAAPPTAASIDLGTRQFVFRDDDAGRRWIDARTRLGADGITVIPLHRVEGALWLDAAATLPMPGAPVSREQQLLLRRHAVTLSHRGAVAVIRNQEGKASWGDAALLHDCIPLVFECGRAKLSANGKAFEFAIDAELGLVVRGGGTTS